MTREMELEACRRGRAAWVSQRSGAVFMRRIESKLAGVTCVNGRKPPAAALLTMMSSRPKCSPMTSIIACTSSRCDTSARIAIARPPQFWIVLTTSLAASAEFRKFTITEAPHAASDSAQARPIPREAPVTSATLPLRSIIAASPNLSQQTL